MHLHTVFFWLKETLSDTDWTIFSEELRLLMTDQNIAERHFGTPADTNRPVIDSSYDIGMVLKFQNLDAQNAYQISAEHQRFLDKCAAMWTRVQVYDISVD